MNNELFLEGPSQGTTSTAHEQLFERRICSNLTVKLCGPEHLHICVCIGSTSCQLDLVSVSSVRSQVAPLFTRKSASTSDCKSALYRSELSTVGCHWRPT